MKGSCGWSAPQPPSPREAWAARVTGLSHAAWHGSDEGLIQVHVWEMGCGRFFASLIPLPSRKACSPHCLYHSENSKWDGCGPCLSAPGEQADSCYSWLIAGAVSVPDRLPLFSRENVLAIWSFYSKQFQNPV